MFDSFEDFKKAVMVSIQDKVSERLDAERQRISNNLFATVGAEREIDAESPEESQSNAEEN